MNTTNKKPYQTAAVMAAVGVILCAVFPWILLSLLVGLGLKCNGQKRD